MTRNLGHRERCIFIVAVAMLCCAVSAMAADPEPLLRAHSHNDYTRAQPLLDALELGFCSVEADIHLIDGELLVAHDKEDVEPGKTLQSMYLDPLLERAKKHGGHIFAKKSRFILLIDIKSSATATYKKLQEVLEGYHEMLSVFTDTSTEEKAVTVLISGNRSTRRILSESPRLAAVDGRIPDLDKEVNCHAMPMISASWGSVFSWEGRGPLPPDQKQRLDELIQKTHERGQLLRFWALPDSNMVWPTVYRSGVDIINADKIADLARYLRGAQSAKKGGARTIRHPVRSQPK